MEYAIPLVLILLVITALIVLLVTRTASKGGSPARDDQSASEGPGIGTDDNSPLADTDQHAGEQVDGRTVGKADAGSAGGAGQGGGYDGTDATGENRQDPHEAAHVQRPGEAEGAARI